MSIGVNFFGPSQTSDGIGRAAALNLQCLNDCGFDVETFVLSRPVALERKKSELVLTDELILDLKHKINYFHFSARWAPYYFAKMSTGALSGFYNIGYWVCEVPKIPDYWAKQLKYYDEIWTASSFCQDAISRSSNIPVIKIPHPVEKQNLTDRVLAKVAQEQNHVFTFLSISNVYSDAERKNILLSARAFISAFGNDNSVNFIIKVSNLERDSILSEALQRIDLQHENITVISGYVGDREIEQLFEKTDVLLSLHRAEGFGFSISDAMSRGIPVITTGYSGNLEFCDYKDTTLIDYELISIGHERLRYKKDDLWAEPNIDSTVSALINIRNNYSSFLHKAGKARDRLRSHNCDLSVTLRIKERIELISKHFEFKNDLENRTLDRDVGVYSTYGF